MGDVLISTLGSEPQGVTWLLDWLLAKSFPIGEVVVIHTQAEVILRAVEVLRAEFPQAYPRLRLRLTPLTDGGRPVEDIASDGDIWALLRAFYREIRAARRAGQTIHLSLVSGRKTMAVFGMVAAQLLFSREDHIWHMISTTAWSGAVKGLHAGPADEFRVIEVPFLRWGDQAAARLLLEGPEDPWEALRRPPAYAEAEINQRKWRFWQQRLTPAERMAAELLVREGLDNAGLARRLGKSPRTVANQLSRVYRACEEWLGMPVNRAVFIAEFAPLFYEDA
ncbi:MAG: CRISPR-associated ring nuclease [Chloroflexota bacterium]